MRIIFVALLVLLAVSTAFAQVTVRGDAAAWQEVTAAYDRLARLQSYRMRITGARLPAPTVVEVVNPDRFHTLIQAEGVTIETIVVGRETRFRIAGPGLPPVWQCQGQPPQAVGPPPDPQAARGEVTISRLPDSTIEGARVRGYQYAWVSSGLTIRQRLYVLVDSGLPRRVEMLDASGMSETVEMTLDYYDFNAPITIELPRCG